MKRLLTISIAMALSLAVWGQSVMISRSLEMVQNSQALVQYNNIFGEWENREVDESFPYVVIQMNLSGNEKSIRASKEKLGLDVGTLYAVTATDRNQENQILFLIPKNVKNIYLLCGDGCEKKLLYSGNLIRNRVYKCTVSYTPAEDKDNETELLKAQMAEMQKQVADLQRQNEEMRRQNTRQNATQEKTTQKQNTYTASSDFTLKDADSYVAFPIGYAYYKFKDDAADIKAMHGVNLGFMFHGKLYKNMIMMLGFEYQYNANNNDTDTLTERFINHKLKIPLNIGFSMPFGKKSSFTLYAGVSVDFDLATLYRQEDNFDYIETNFVTGSYKGEIDGKEYSGKDESDKTMEWLDFPIGIGAIYKYGKLGFKFQYSWGLVNRRIDDKYKVQADQLTATLFISF